MSWTDDGAIIGDATGARAEAKRCEWITRTPIHAKIIGGYLIDPSEWENEHGAFLRYLETRCYYAADADKKYCPRHEMEAALLVTNRDDVQDAAAGER